MHGLPLRFLSAIALCSFTAMADGGSVPASADPADELAERFRSENQPAVLFVGNSYSFGVPTVFRQLVLAAGQSIRIGEATRGGWNLARHAEHEPTLREIREGSWDVVVLQEHSLRPAQPAELRDPQMLPAILALAAAAREAGAIPVLYQTWGRRDGDPDVPDDDFHAMQARLIAGYQVASEAAGGLEVIPVGEAWARRVLAGRGDRLFAEDGSHPSARGDRLTARVFYRAFFER